VKFLLGIVFVAIGVAFTTGEANAQLERLEQIDLQRHGLANPEQDCAAAIKRHDLRFIGLDREGRDTPGTERYRRIVRRQGVKFVKQPFWLFPTASDRFSFNLRARDYALRYNTMLLTYLRSARAAKRR
jgi:hypothetical protein